MTEKHGFRVTIVADSISPSGVRLTTLQLRYPRFIHAEFMTHRVFSRNSSSSRAIPVAKMIEQVREDPAMPIHWGKNEPGMQAWAELDDVEMNTPWGTTDRQQAKNLWRAAAEKAADSAESLAKVGAHKQIVNRILEPWQWMNTIVTATEWDNFFALRCHTDAQPEIQLLAQLMLHEMDEMEYGVPTPLSCGQWHLPYITQEDTKLNDVLDRCKISAARCARVSYNKHDGTAPSVEEDLALFERLVGSEPRHASPLEHQATPIGGREKFKHNLRGWMSLRYVERC